MNRRLWTIGLLIWALPIFAQKTTAEECIAPWLGHWKGNLIWQIGPDSSQTVEMHLVIAPLDSLGQYSWNLVYGADQADNRGYTLKPVDLESGHWVVDENNGILIDQYLFGNTFSSAFEVMGTRIVDAFEVNGDQMNVRFFSFGNEAARTSGQGTDDVPIVYSFPMRSVQSVVLYRLSN